jgi:hypothetical protein
MSKSPSVAHRNDRISGHAAAIVFAGALQIGQVVMEATEKIAKRHEHRESAAWLTS